MTRISDEPARLLAALRTAGCDCFIDPEDGNLYISPPAHRRCIDWPDDPEEAIELHYWELKELVSVERLTIH
jgi:hypothetical protein